VPKGPVKRRKRPPRATPASVAPVWAALSAHYPKADCALHHRNPFELLVATILSAQCTDARVNLVTPELFARWPTAFALAKAGPAELEGVIRSTGFFRNKTKSLLGMSRRLTEAYGGEVPRGMDDLLTLPGVARKTANVVRGVSWGLADGVVVDTHVARLAQRLGWTGESTPEKIERDLMALLPREDWVRLSHVLIHHGRALCQARTPRCAACPVREACPSALC